jgi:fatty-acyl-CoA synthase
MVVAVVVPKDGRQLDAEAVTAALDGRIARFKHPKEVLFLRELPKTALGKVRKDELRKIAGREIAA